MRIVFFGTPDFAVASLSKIYESEFKISAVVTAPDKERGRGRKVSFTPAKEFAIEKNIPVLQPTKLKEKQFITELKKFNADLFVIVAFRILPVEVFTLPKYGSINLHGSLLPKYRGAAPIQWALINGDEETGVTTFFLKEKVDTGNMILQEKIAIDPEDNFETLNDKMKEVGAEVLLKTISMIEKGEVNEQSQDDSSASPAPKITKEICEINWTKAALDIHNLIRGVSPYPGAFFVLDDKQYKVYKSKVVDLPILQLAEIFEDKKEIFIGCGEGTLQILEIQPEGRKRMTAEEFLRGYRLIN
ncbi:MAG: methionyl-tRNA formyltransferase [Melioribacteraceae bacterium]|nr:MAG: methionyl-tRNA formyltransferase [Melioribacteraceae bacterium]